MYHRKCDFLRNDTKYFEGAVANNSLLHCFTRCRNYLTIVNELDRRALLRTSCLGLIHNIPRRKRCALLRRNLNE